VFTSNIKRGSDFLANFSGIFILILTLNWQWQKKLENILETALSYLNE
jgi:hypothetical protein